MADKKTSKEKQWLRKVRAWLLKKSKGETVATQEKQIKELFPEDEDNKKKKKGNNA